MTMALTASSTKKVSLSVKIDPEIDARIKRARKAAREVGLRFNVSKEVEEALLKSLNKIEKTLKLQQDIRESESQMDLLSGESGAEEKTSAMTFVYTKKTDQDETGKNDE